MNSNTLKTAGAALALTIMAFGQPVMASGYGAISAETRAQIETQLTADGYDVRKIKMEHGKIEVYALKDGARLELYLDENLNVMRTKQDD